MWRFKKNEDEDICMAAAGFICLASPKEKKHQEAFLGEANIE
jgi:hypothetical protein